MINQQRYLLSRQKALIPSVFLLLTLLSFINLANTQITSLNCPILGPDFPAPHNFLASTIISNVEASHMKLLSDYVSTIGHEDIFFPISLLSLFQYHHSPTVVSGDSPGVHTVYADSIYQIGSCSEVSSVWTFLIEADDSYFKDSITR